MQLWVSSDAEMLRVNFVKASPMSSSCYYSAEYRHSKMRIEVVCKQIAATFLHNSVLNLAIPSTFNDLRPSLNCSYKLVEDRSH